MRHLKLIAVCVLVASLFLAPQAPARQSAEETFVLAAGQWGARQNRAVRDAGGTIVWSHRRTGIGVVTSANAGFLDEVMGGRAFNFGEVDQMVDWDLPVVAEHSESDFAVAAPDAATVTPGDEPFFFLQCGGCLYQFLSMFGFCLS